VVNLEKDTTVLSFDPGKVNHAFSVTKFCVKKLSKFKPMRSKLVTTKDKMLLVRNAGEEVLSSVKYLAVGKLEHPIADLKTDIVAEHGRFVKEVRGIINKYKPDLIVVERFQTRGGKAASFMGAILESVNIQIGTILSLAATKKIPATIIIAATWKNAVKHAGIKIDDVYKANKKNPHVIDAALMGIYLVGCLKYLNPVVYPVRYQELKARMALVKDTKAAKPTKRKNKPAN